jgi:hypothetical protein
MKLRTRLIVGILIVLLSLPLLTIPLSSAVNFPADSFCVDDQRNWNFYWDVTVFNETAYSDPVFNNVGDMLIWDIQQISTMTAYDLSTDEIDGKISCIDAVTQASTDITGNNAWLGWYRRYGNDRYDFSVTYGPMIAPRNATAIFRILNETYYFENNNITSWTASGLLIIIAIFNGTSFQYGEAYQELAFNNDGILQYWLKAVGNGTAWVPVFRLEYQAKRGIPGFPILPTLLVLSLLLSISALIPKKKQL